MLRKYAPMPKGMYDSMIANMKSRVRKERKSPKPVKKWQEMEQAVHQNIQEMKVQQQQMREEITRLRQERLRPATVAKPSTMGHLATPPPQPPRIPLRDASLERLQRARDTASRTPESTDQVPTGAMAPQEAAHQATPHPEVSQEEARRCRKH